MKTLKEKPSLIDSESCEANEAEGCIIHRDRLSERASSEGVGLEGMMQQSGLAGNEPQEGVSKNLPASPNWLVTKSNRTEKFTNGLASCLNLFADHKKFNDGTAKTDCDTNMTLDNTIGHPSLFDLVGFTGELEYGVSQADFNDFYTRMMFRWIFGQNTVFTRVTLKKMPQGIGPVGFNSAGTIITQGLAVLGNFYNYRNCAA